jgi:hypothetical protein
MGFLKGFLDSDTPMGLAVVAIAGVTEAFALLRGFKAAGHRTSSESRSPHRGIA